MPECHAGAGRPFIDRIRAAFGGARRHWPQGVSVLSNLRVRWFGTDVALWQVGETNRGRNWIVMAVPKRLYQCNRNHGT